MYGCKFNPINIFKITTNSHIYYFNITDPLSPIFFGAFTMKVNHLSIGFHHLRIFGTKRIHLVVIQTVIIPKYMDPIIDTICL